MHRIKSIHLVLLSLLNLVEAQFCSDVCPPLNRLNINITSLCEGDRIQGSDSAKEFESCFGDHIGSFKLSDFKGSNRAIVISNYYYGSDGQKESAVFAHTGDRLRRQFGDSVVFISSNKGADCREFADEMADDASRMFPGVRPEKMPLVMHDTDSILRDLLFTPPFPEPSYVVLDGNLEVRHKIIGPCCGKTKKRCKDKHLLPFKKTLTNLVKEVLSSTTGEETDGDNDDTNEVTKKNECEIGEWSVWSNCSITCGGEGSGTEFRYRTVSDNRDPYDPPIVEPCPHYIETRPCTPLEPVCTTNCTKEIGPGYNVTVIAEGFNGARDVAFTPTPGVALGKFSEGRKFTNENVGDGEAWVVNGNNHSISIVSAVQHERQTTISRRDRAYFHNLINVTAISFNSVSNSGRDQQRDSYGYWSVCNDNLNDYLGTKKPNYFMGPTLFNSYPEDNNTVNGLGNKCKRSDECNFNHIDMLHEAPGCIGIVHDPELGTSHGNVYWAFDAVGNKEDGQLVRFDFQQPHGPGSEDHSIASVRRYPQVKLNRAESQTGVHAGMVMHPTSRELYIANPGDGTIVVVKADSGSYARDARHEYPVYSNKLPTFIYSVWECADETVFASGLNKPSGLALSHDGERLYVAEHESGNITVYEVASGTVLHTIETNYTSIEGLAISYNSDTLYFVDSMSNTLNAIQRNATCETADDTRVNANYTQAVLEAEIAFRLANMGEFYIYRNNTCMVDKNGSGEQYFDVPDSTGFASDDPNVQGPMMDETAKELARRKDCGKKSDLNFDQLILGGYYCHRCLPSYEELCEAGGTCTNHQWRGYTCDNQYTLNSNNLRLFDSMRNEIDLKNFVFDPDLTYHFNIAGPNEIFLSKYRRKDEPLSLPGNPKASAKNAPLVFTPRDFPKEPHEVYFRTRFTKKLKIKIGFECEDRNLVYKGDPAKDCEWLGSNTNIRNRLCNNRRTGWIARTCPKTCGKC